MQIDYGSVCSGIEAATAAWEPLGMTPAWFAEIEPFPSAVLAHHYPQVHNHGDMTKLGALVLAGKIDAPDVLVGGTPCFTAGAMVLCEDGYRPIETIAPGDLVVTHTGQLKPVLRIGTKQADVGLLKAVGLPFGITTTAGHPFLAVNFRMQSTKRNNAYALIEHCGEPEWVKASDMPGLNWCALTDSFAKPSRPIPGCFSPDKVMRIAGMYLGDGYTRNWTGKNKKALVLCLNPSKADLLQSWLPGIGSYAPEVRGSVKVTINNTILAEWLAEEFGQLAHGKRIPAWALSHDFSADLLQGYIDTDGGLCGNGFVSNTISKALAYGVADIAGRNGYVSAVSFVKTANNCTIEGRTINQSDYWSVKSVFENLSKKSRVRHGYRLRRVQSFTPCGSDTVYNIEVTDDHSYVVNGALVHNCQAFSVAGMRQGMLDPRGALTIKYVELADAVDHVRTARGDDECVVVWENVPGVLSDKGNAFGCFLGALAGEDSELFPSGKRWQDAGCVYGPKRTVAWRILDAQYFGLAQRRRRVFVVASARRGFDPVAVLFEREGVRRDTAPRRGEGQDVTGTLAGGARKDGGYSTDDIPMIAPALRAQAQSSHRADSEALIAVSAYGGGRTSGTMCITGEITHTLKAEGFDGSEDGTGRGQPIVAAFAENSRAELRYEDGDGEITGSLSGGGGKAGQGMPAAQVGASVRRLTPVECERLQGFPDGYTLIPWRGKRATDCPDGPRYKAIGNSKAVPVVRWIGLRLLEQL
ncbi:DNA cytosine methyltransferase [Pseudomonas petrae]|uniref:DNA cytosine methyltransferase n=1 Tax=Pseudomonas petrae TaxID=2912190 RepID=UPI001EFF9C6E|nr:DNA cytosine methyltransferase [Pseudomonas petrae]MCF7536205.1 DNA cytosine methyltransferase [Pseudomonas petrae]